MAHKYVLDAHALIWYIESNPRLGADAKGVMDEPGSEMVLPLIALAEAAWIVERRRTSIPAVSILLSRVRTDPRVEVYPVTWDVFQQSLAAQAVPELHDRLIVATALHVQSLGHTVALLTKDSAIIASRLVPIRW